MREEKRWLRHENGFSHFSFGCKSYKQSGYEGPSPTATQIKLQIHHLESENIRESILDFRFCSPFWRNKPRHALSLQTGSVGAQNGCFCLFPSVRRESMKKNVKSSIFRKKTSKFLSSLPFKTQTIDNQ